MRRPSPPSAFPFSLLISSFALFFRWYLTAEDKELMAIRYRANAIYNGKQDFDWKQVKASLTDYKLYLNGFAQFSMNTASFGYSNFLPTIIKGTPSLLLFDVRGCLLTRAVV